MLKSIVQFLLPLFLGLRVNFLIFFWRVFEAVQMYVPGKSELDVMAASFSNPTWMGWEDCQLYMGTGFPVAVQFKVISSPGSRYKTSGSGLKNVGGTWENENKKNYTLKHLCTWYVWRTAFKLTVHRRIKRLRSHSWRWLWSLWSQFQHSYAPVLCSVLCPCWGDYQDGGHLDRWGRCEVGEGVVVHFSLPSVPPKCEVLNRSNVLDITEQLVFLPFHHGPRVVNRPDGDAIGCFCEKMTQT